ncbi:hypothetical protein SAMN05444161_8683 [Rhizobiales bacterium GAS191]|nr:hypothetical protein SAMN05444161_8683 [Rhizobiales bacterium GAS191]
MSLTAAAALALILSFVISGMIAMWYLAPWLGKRRRAEALTFLLWTQVFRYVALQIFSAQQFGFGISDAGRDQIALGDVAGTILALLAIIALRYGLGIATVLTWVVVAETGWDLANVTVIGVREQLFAKAFGSTWLIVTFYAPFLWVTLALTVWQLLSRRREEPREATT